jgi:N-acetylglucosamine kinase-like BadF-type ATPase
VSDLSGAGYGLAGLDWPSDEQRLLPLVHRLGVPGPQVLVNDAYVALHAGTDDGRGVAVIAGTGATVAGRNRRGEQFRTLGLGEAWGDFGGAGDVLAQATRAMVYAYTGRGPATTLTERFCAALGARDVLDLAERVTRGQVARLDRGLVRQVFDVAAAGDPVARDILIHAGQEQARNVIAVAQRLGMLAEPFDLVLAGGLFRDGSALYRDALIAYVRERAPAMRPASLLGAPVVGGVLLAMRAAGEDAGAGVRQQLVSDALRHPVLTS